MSHLEHQFGIASFNWSLKICPLILIVAGGRSSTIMSSVASWSSLPSSSLPSSLNSSSHILARFPQQEGTDLLLVDHYHQGEGILAGVSNEHHLPLLVLQVTAVLVLNRFECFNFPKYRSTNFKAIFPFLQAFCLSPLISLFMSLKLYTMAMDLALYLLLWFGGPH